MGCNRSEKPTGLALQRQEEHCETPAIAAATALLALFYRICRLFPVKRQVVH